MDNFLALVKKRRSIRAYREKTIPEEIIDYILEAGRLAPSSENLQPWKFYVVRNKSTIFKLSKAAPLKLNRYLKFIASADTIIVLVAEKKPVHWIAKLIGKDYHELDVMIAGEHMVLAATDKNIGSCWIGWFSEKKVKRILNLNPAQKPIAMIALGYPQEEKEEVKNRLSKNKVVVFIGDKND